MGIVADGAATAFPFIPAGAGTYIKVTRAAQKVERVINKADAAKNTVEGVASGDVGSAVQSATGLAGKKGQAGVQQNKHDGLRRERDKRAELQQQHPDASVQSERDLRTSDGKRAVDSKTGTGRRIDHVVIKDGKAVKSIETTSPTADKAAQSAKEDRIRQAGGTFVRDKESRKLVDLKGVPTEIDRRD